MAHESSSLYPSRLTSSLMNPGPRDCFISFMVFCVDYAALSLKLSSSFISLGIFAGILFMVSR